MRAFFKGSILGKIVATILAIFPIVQLIPAWYSTTVIFKNSLALRIVLFLVYIFVLWIAAFIGSLWWIWISAE